MAVKIALAGNPNCGKTTLFNALTGANQYVGNWPGVTVEKKEGKLIGHKDVDLVDLPGIYSLSPYTLEEVVARNYLIGEQPDAIINIVDGTNIERNLYLTTQIIELGIPVLMAINMMDIVRKNGDKINIKALGEKLGCEVVEISALKKTGIKETAEKAIEIAKSGKSVQRVHHFADDVESTIAGIEEKLGLAVAENQKRFFAIKLLERDSKISEVLKSAPNVDDEIKALEDKYDDDTESIITNERYQYISSIIGSCVKKARAGKETVSDKIDKIVTNRFLALPIFALIMWGVYYVAVSSLGGIVTDWTNDTLFGEWIQPAVQTFMENAGCSDWLVSLVVEGIIGGLGAPIGFAPQMAIVFLFLSILEDCGYMARVAFIMDRIFRRFGLSGKSFIPFLIGSGCGVPGIMATRTIENEKDRRMTMMTVTNIPCGAKLPVIALIAGFIMGDGCWWMAPLMYFAGIGLTIIYCIILKKTRAFAGKTTCLSLLAGLEKPDEGEILLDGENIQNIGGRKLRQNSISLVFQDYQLFDYMTSLENVMVAAQISLPDVPKKELIKMCRDSLVLVGLDDSQITRKVTELSGGQQQRVAIARALITDAKYILADEPTGNLDKENRRKIVELLQQIAHEQDRCVIVVTHSDYVKKKCDICYEMGDDDEE